MNFGAKLYASLQGDRVIWMILAVLSIFSILAVYSSTGTIAWKISGGNTTAYLIKHTFILCFGLFLAFLAYKTPYQRYMQMAPFLWLVAFLLLGWTLLYGVEINYARRWIRIPFVNVTFQTSDFAKLALILLVAREITRHKDYIKDFNKAFVPIILPIILICGLIAPADLSTSLVLFSTTLLMMFIGRVDMKYMFLLLLLWVVMFAALIVLAEFFPEIIRLETWTSRIQEYMAAGDGSFQNQQAKIAIANGEIFGVGPGNSIQRNYLPTPYADFIYAIICEEWGLIGGITMLGLYVLLFFRTTRLVTISEKSFGALAAIGLSLNIVIQALANMAISVHLIPVSGLTLPMVSWGGTSVLFTCLFFGIILSVSRSIESGIGLAPVAAKKAEAKGEAPKSDGDGGAKKEGDNKGGGGYQKRDGNRNYNRDNRGGGNRDNRGGGGYNKNRDNRGGGNYNRDNRGGGGYNKNRDNRGGGGNYNRDNRGGGGGNRDNRGRN